MKGVKHVRRWKEEALRGELCEPSYVAILRHHSAGTRSRDGQEDLVAAAPDRGGSHRRGRDAVPARTHKALVRVAQSGGDHEAG